MKRSVHPEEVPSSGTVSKGEAPVHRELTLAEVAVIDVSFISLRLVLPAVLRLVVPGAVLLPLVKPQFEVGKGEVGKGGVVRDPEQQRAAVNAVRACGITLGLTCHGDYPSPVLGPKGNQEYFLYFSVTSTNAGTSKIATEQRT